MYVLVFVLLCRCEFFVLFSVDDSPAFDAVFCLCLCPVVFMLVSVILFSIHCGVGPVKMLNRCCFLFCGVCVCWVSCYMILDVSCRLLCVLVLGV